MILLRYPRPGEPGFKDAYEDKGAAISELRLAVAALAAVGAVVALAALVACWLL